jgi:hypothetical protein
LALLSADFQQPIIPATTHSSDAINTPVLMDMPPFHSFIGFRIPFADHYTGPEDKAKGFSAAAGFGKNRWENRWQPRVSLCSRPGRGI